MIHILYEDAQILVCHKPAGLAVQSASLGRQDLESMVRTSLMERSGRANPYLGVVHRLDQPVQGVIVFAKTPQAAASLSRQVQDGGMTKEYLAVLCGSLPEASGTLVHYLKKEKNGNRSLAVSANTRDARKAVLSYETLSRQEGLSLVRIRLQTGRHHQIRVQMAAAGVPVYGDTKYNPSAVRGQTLALCASRLALRHPESGERMEFFAKPEGFPMPCTDLADETPS